MSRRTIVIDGTPYKWTRTKDGTSVVVFPPKGGGGPVQFRLEDDHDPDDWGRDCAPVVTPGIVAGFIHRHILKRPEPPRKAAPPARVASPARKWPNWETSHEVPRVHTVLCTLHAEGDVPTTFAVEGHVDSATALESVRELSHASDEIKGHYGVLVAWDRAGRRWAKPEFRARRGSGCSGFPGLSAWMDACLSRGCPAIREVSFGLMQVPLRVPAPPVESDAWHRAWTVLRDRPANTLARMEVPLRPTA